MKQRTKTILIGGLILLIEIIVFWEHLSPVLWGQIKVTGLSCTCPDESVDKGRLYLRFITPDRRSLRKTLRPLRETLKK